MKIFKYITRVEHSKSGGTNNLSVENRSRKSIADKYANTVKVERGDIVTYEIQIENSSRFPTQVKVQDILPNQCIVMTIAGEFNYIGLSNNEKPASWITVRANSVMRFIVRLKAEAISGTYKNEVRFITTNGGSEHMRYEVWGRNSTHGIHYYGNIVNEDESRIVDSDFYTIKEYDVSLDKNIVEVKHSSNNQVTYTGTERKNIAENKKKTNPVYVEYGDIVKYEIDIYNTMKPYLNAGSKNRGQEPFWNPDIAYVDIKDTLPKKYSNLTVNVSNGTGEKNISKGSFTIKNIKVPAGGKTTITVTLVVEEHTRLTLEENNVKLDGDVRNVNKLAIKNHSGRKTTSDWYKINDYNISIYKYINQYNKEMMNKNNNNGLTNEESKITDRYSMTEQQKYDKPLQVEKTETIEYAIRLNNDAKSVQVELPSGEKKPTAVRTSVLTDTFQNGLKYKSSYARIYTKDGKDKYNQKIVTEAVDQGNNTYQFKIKNYLDDGRMIIIEPGEYIIYYIGVEITESNMYLHRLANTAAITVLTNKNNTDTTTRQVKNDNYDENIGVQKASSDYVKMKDLVISGKVWLDRDKDGLMDLNKDNKFDQTIDAAANGSTHIEYPEGSSEYAMKNIVVKLYSVGTGENGADTLLRTTKTDENGLFTFGRKEDGTSWYNGTYSYDGDVTESEQRIDKATSKDANKNYTEDSKLIKYYIEYLYDGIAYKSTEVYAGSSRLDEHGRIDSEGIYKIDSSAAEFKDVRDIFDEKYEIIAFDKAYRGDLTNPDTLSYEKNGHNSWIKEYNIRGQEDETGKGIMKSRSFIDKSNQSTNYLWLFKQGEEYQLPETEYLKYINLGLEEREDVDISITQDLYEIKTTVNGEEMVYEYNQNDYTLGNEKIDKAQYTDERFNSELYMTGYTDDTSTLLPYEFWLYNSDYNYKVSQYNTETVRNYKGTESELNVETTFRIKVTNNSITDDEPYLEDGKKDIKVYTGINEIAEFYDNQYVDLEFDEEGNVKTFYVKTKDENGYLVNTPLGVVKAEYVKRDGTRQEAVLSNKSIYNPENGGIRTLKDSEGNNLYSTLYIRPKVAEGEKLAGNVILEEGESVDILITFVIDKEVINNELYVYVDEMMSVGEITSYSTYYKKEDGTYYSAGLVDKDSNPGNFGELYGLPSNKNVDSQEYLAIYEDDTFKMGINIFLQLFEKDRAITGFVWDDARTEIADDGKGKQYIGDGIYNPNINAVEKQPNAQRNENVSNKEETDIVIKDMKTQLIEMVRVPIKDASGNLLEERVYEETIYACGENSQMTMNTDAEGKYMLKGYIPGDYIVKFFYGHDVNSESMIIFNGQDYKSTKYQAEQEGKSKTYAEYQVNSDLLLEKLEEENISDAKDDEIKRLEAISYSEVMNNDLNNVLRGKNSSNKQYLISNTNMESETTTFLVRPEKEKLEKKSLTYEEAITRFNTITRHPIKNVDFGIEYRPELQVSLNKYIANITITTSDANGKNSGVPLVDARFNEYYGIVVKTDHDTGITTFLADQNGEVIRVPENASNTDVETAVASAGVTIPEGIKDSSGRYVITIAGTELDTDNSIGLSNLQYVENIDDIQGFAYLNIDDEIMQGSRIAIKYLFVGNNLSEVDRVSSNLSELRFKENDTALAYRGDSDKFYDEVSFQLGENTGFIDADYSGARTARNRLFNEYYGYELNESNEIKKDKLGSDIRYRKKAKKIEVDENKKVIKAVINNPNNDSTYYGRYLGSLYYTGVIGEQDIVAEVKVDKILDYLDNDLVFETKNNNSSNNLWKATTSNELLNNKLVNGNSFITLGAGSTTDSGLIGLSGKYLLDSKNRAYDTNEKSNLALLQDDRIKDYANEAEDKTINKDISRFLLPRLSDSNESYGKVSLVATKVVSAEELTEDMNYDNIGEIVQYSSITGRVTPFTTTLGNVSFFEQNDDGTLKKDHDGDCIPVKEWDEAQTESDTSATELITLTPPTGLGRVQRVVRNTVEGMSYVVIATIVVAVIDLAIMIGITLYRKRRIK